MPQGYYSQCHSDEHKRRLPYGRWEVVWPLRVSSLQNVLEYDSSTYEQKILNKVK